MSAEQPGPMILAIAVSDDFLRVYRNDRHLLADNKLLVAAEERFGALEFFDSKGYRLAGKYDQRWRLLCFEQTAEGNEKLVLERIQTTLKNVRCYIESHPKMFEMGDATVDDALALVPDLDGSPDLATSMVKLAEHFDELDPPRPARGLRRFLSQRQPKGGFKCRWCCATGLCNCC